MGEVAMDTLPDIIETTRLHLRPFRLQDADAVLAYATDIEWARFLPVPQPYSAADAERFLAGQVLLDRQRQPSWAIEYAGAVRGGINIRFDFENRVGELGYGIARGYWGQGLTTEAGWAVLDLAFSVYAILNRVRAMADPRNIGSLRVMEKLGMIREGLLRQNRVVRGQLVDEVWCGILRKEWESKRSKSGNTEGISGTANN
jgi:RimJ/RimL family protein N-acetyltransferase